LADFFNKFCGGAQTECCVDFGIISASINSSKELNDNETLRGNSRVTTFIDADEYARMQYQLSVSIENMDLMAIAAVQLEMRDLAAKAFNEKFEICLEGMSALQLTQNLSAAKNETKLAIQYAICRMEYDVITRSIEKANTITKTQAVALGCLISQ